jgi:hypothetical protein
MRHIGIVLIVLTLAWTLPGCITSLPKRLTLQGQRITIVTNAQVANCQFLAFVRSGSITPIWGGLDRDQMMNETVNIARNKAAAKGGTHLTLGEPQDMDMSGSLSNYAGVKMNSKVYRCSTP